MDIKKKVIFGMVAGFFAVTTVLNMNMLKGNESAVLSSIQKLAFADPEWPNGDHYADVPICDEFEIDGVTYYKYEVNCWTGSDECIPEDCW